MWTEIGNTFWIRPTQNMGKQKKWGQHEIYVFDPDHVGVSFMFNPHPTRSSSSPSFNFKRTYIWSAGVPLRQPFQNFLGDVLGQQPEELLGLKTVGCLGPFCEQHCLGNFPWFDLFLVCLWVDLLLDGKKGNEPDKKTDVRLYEFFLQSHWDYFMPLDSLDLPMFFCCCGGRWISSLSLISALNVLPQYLAVNPASVWGLIKKGSLSGVEEGRHKIRGYCKLCGGSWFWKCVEYCGVCVRTICSEPCVSISIDMCQWYCDDSNWPSHSFGMDIGWLDHHPRLWISSTI